ncbi:MAG TPA: RNA polymerase sigma factor [Tepidisphaeraceae bacterium]|nr:RNA polymerase sigma factor [Tepidisphaeraceae bacterium]
MPPGSGETRKVPTDAELLEQTGRGEQAAFGELVNRHGRYLYGIARGLTGNNAADAEDLVQETLIGVLNSRFRGESAVRTWLVSILVRRAAMLRRSRKRQAGWIENPAAEPAVRQQATGQSEARLDLAMMLEALSPEHRQIIILRELEQMSYEEMAKELGVPRGTVESRLFRAREELRKRFKGY